MTYLKTLLMASALVVTAFSAQAAGSSVELPKQDWGFKDANFQWDKKELMRGYEVAKNVCLACHNFDYFKHRNLQEIGFSEEEAKFLAKDLELKVGDSMKSPLTAEDAVAAYAKELPDLSMMVRARPGGADYVYALLTGYEETPEGTEIPDTAYYNKYYPGHAIAMPAPLTQGGQIDFWDESESSIEDMARAVTYFMAWTAEPEMEQRQRTGTFALIYLFILAGLLYAIKRRIWKDLH